MASLQDRRAWSVTRQTRRALGVAVCALSVANATALAVLDGPDASVADVGMALGSPATTDSSLVSPSGEAPTATAPSVRSTPSTTQSRKASKKDTETSVAAELPIASEGYPFELELAPTCTSVGSAFTAVVRIKPHPDTAISFMPIYANGSQEQGQSGFAAPDGTARYSWLAGPAPGEGRLIAQVLDGETRAFGTKIVAFRVVGVGKSC